MSDPSRSPVVRVLVPAATPTIRVQLPSPQGPDEPDAYAVWLAAGHTGSRADFLASLKGGGLPPQWPIVPPGYVGDAPAAKISVAAATPLGGHRVIRATLDGARYASADRLTDAGLVLGITVAAADKGSQVRFVAEGDLTEPSWRWSLGPVYCGIDGMLTQSPPPAAFEQQVGTAMAADRIVVRIDPHIVLVPRS